MTPEEAKLLCDSLGKLRGEIASKIDDFYYYLSILQVFDKYMDKLNKDIIKIAKVEQ